MANFPVVVTTGAWQGIKPTLARALARKLKDSLPAHVRALGISAHV